MTKQRSKNAVAKRKAPKPPKAPRAMGRSLPGLPDTDRKTAAAAKKRAVSGRRHLILGWAGAWTLVVGFGYWAVFSEIAGAVIASGQIAVESNRQVVQHPDGGVVASLSVNEGDVVANGDVLLKLDDALLRSNYQILSDEKHEILARVARLTAERNGAADIDFPQELLAAAEVAPTIQEFVDGQRNLFEARVKTRIQEINQLERRKEQIASQIEGVIAQQTSLDAQLGLINQELEDQQTLLEKGLTQASRVLSLQREKARLEGEIGELIASQAELGGRSTEIDIEILKLDTARREQAITETRDLRFRLAEKEEQISSLEEQLSRMEIRAPVSGVVYNLTIFGERSVIRPADPVLYLVPQDRPLVIQSRVETINVDEVYPGQAVTLLFPAFNSRTTPVVFGTVRQVSADAFTDQNTGLTFYTVEITLDEDQAERLGENVLLPGMPVEAYIRTEDRSPLTYFLKPFTDYFNRAFRES